MIYIFAEAKKKKIYKMKYDKENLRASHLRK